MACVLLTYMALDLFGATSGIITRVIIWSKHAPFVVKKQRSSVIIVEMNTVLTMQLSVKLVEPSGASGI